MKIKNNRFKHRIFQLLLVLLFIVVFIATIIIFIRYFQIKIIEIYGPQMYLTGLEKIGEANIFLIDTNEAKRTLLKDNYLLQDVEISKKYPDTLVFKTSRKHPAAIILNSSSVLLVSQDGIILEKDSIISPGLPIIIENRPPYKIGEVADNSVRAMIFLAKELSDLSIEIAKINIDNNAQIAIIVLPDDTQIIISLTNDLNTLPASLQIIMTRFRIEGKKPVKIDFRFEKPIVTLTNGENLSP